MARPFRYTFILVLVALGTTLAAVGGWRYARASAPVPGPIILISIDTLRADHLPAYGYQKIKTPAIDSLARDGIVFERAYSHSPQTFPAHVAMLTGRLPFETGVRDDDGGALKPGERLLAQMLRDRGYATAGIVSSGLLRRANGLAQGFDFFDDEMPAGDGELTPGERRRDGAASAAVAERWLDNAGTTRLFLFLQLHDPHAPWPATATAAPYDAQITAADEVVGRFVRYLKAHQLYDQSTIVLVADHGESLGDHGEREHGLFVYEESIHVPLILKQAAGVGAGRRIAEVVQHADIVPTVLDLAKAPVPGNLRGRSLKPVADGAGTLPTRFVYSETRYGRNRFGWSELVSMKDARFQYIRAPREELYDLRRDPHQQENIVDQPGTTRQTRDAMRAALARLLGEDPAPVKETTEIANAAADPKDKREIVETYRAGLQLVADRQWHRAIDVFQRISQNEPDSTAVWTQLAGVATLAERYDLALSACQRLIDLDSSDARPLLDAGRLSLKLHRLDDAEDFATRAVDAAASSPRPAADAHGLLADVALARRDHETARSEAKAARQADPSSVLPLYIEAKLHYDQGNFEDALALLEKANAGIRKDQAVALPGLRFLTAQTLVHAYRSDEAEAPLIDELRDYPHNLNARAALATLYQQGGEPERAADVVRDLVRLTPSPESYAMAAKFWTSLGDHKQAASTRADGRRLFSNLRNAH